MGEQRSVVGFLAEWLETSPLQDKSILVSPKSSEVDQRTLPGLLACCPDAETGYLNQTVSEIAAGHSVIALYPEEKITESIVDRVDLQTANLCVTLWPGFDRKKDDAEGSDFYYPGQASSSNTVQTSMAGENGKKLDVVSMNLDSVRPIEDGLFEYIAAPAHQTS